MSPDYLIQVRWPDIDQLGHVNNAVVLTYAETGRDQFLAACGLAAEAYVVRHCVIDYQGELAPSTGSVTYRCSVSRVGTTSIVLNEHLLDDAGEPAVVLDTTLVLWDPAARTTRAVTDSERAALAREGNSHARVE